MEEKVKNRILIYIIVVLVLVILVLTIVGIIGYKQLTQYNENSNALIEENIVNNYIDNVISDNEQYNGSIEKGISINGNNCNIELRYNNTDLVIEDNNIETAKLYKQEYKLIVDEKIIENIEDGARWIKINSDQILNEDLYDVAKIKDSASDKEYLILKINIEEYTAGPITDVYIIDTETGKIMEKLRDSRNDTAIYLKEKMDKDEDGNYITNQNAELFMQISDKDIVEYKYNPDSVEQIRYTINNGEIISNLEKTYNIDEVVIVGKSY